MGYISRWGQLSRLPVETGVCYGKPTEAQLPKGAIADFAVRFNALCVSAGGFNPRRRSYAPNLNYTICNLLLDKSRLDMIHIITICSVVILGCRCLRANQMSQSAAIITCDVPVDFPLALSFPSLRPACVGSWRLRV